MGDVNGCRSKSPLQGADLDPHLDTPLGIKIGKRFVEQEYRRLADDGAPHGNALSLTARQSTWQMIQIRCQVEQRGGSLHRLSDIRLWQFAKVQAETHILRDRHMRIERIILENHRDIPVLRGNIIHDPAIEPNGSARQVLKTSDDSEQCRFTTSRATNQGNELAIIDLQINPVQDSDQAVTLAKVDNLYICRRKLQQEYRGGHQERRPPREIRKAPRPY